MYAEAQPQPIAVQTTSTPRGELPQAVEWLGKWRTVVAVQDVDEDGSVQVVTVRLLSGLRLWLAHAAVGWGYWSVER